MAVSYSFHISSKSHAVTNTGKVGQVSKHNLREYKSASYDKSQIEVLVGSSDNLLNDIKRVYHQEFDEALEQYNQKQKRADRKIDDYLTHVSDSRSDVAVEVIIQLGDKDFWKDKDQTQQKSMTHIFKDQLKALGEYCPDFKVASAVIHYDESSPHMHVVGVPVARGYEKGMETQCAKTKVFTKESLTFLQDKMRERAEIGMDMFYNISLKSKEKGRNKDIPKHSLDEYYKLQADIQNSKDENDFWQKQNDLYMEKAINARDEASELEKNFSQLKEKISDTEKELATKSEALDQQAEQIERIDAVTQLLAHTDVKDDLVENLTIPEKKTIFGRVEVPERQGAFIEGMDMEQVKALMQRASAEDGLQKVYDDVIQKAETDAKAIRASATKEKNEIVAKAQSVLDERNGIIQRAKDWAKSYQDKYNDLVAKFNDLAHRFNDLVGKRNKLKGEIDRLEASRGDLEPLRKEVEELTRAKQIVSGELDYELTRAKFKPWSAMPFGADYSSYRKRGELLALYKDGTTRLVGSNPNGGFDYKTLDDEKNGLCRVGIMVDEERVQVPKSLLKELMQARDREKPISQSLQNLILQQTEVDRTVQRHRGVSR
jgi:uncharacterized coiled-coil DUF342 family protein